MQGRIGKNGDEESFKFGAWGIPYGESYKESIVMCRECTWLLVRLCWVLVGGLRR